MYDNIVFTEYKLKTGDFNPEYSCFWSVNHKFCIHLFSDPKKHLITRRISVLLYFTTLWDTNLELIDQMVHGLQWGKDENSPLAIVTRGKGFENFTSYIRFCTWWPFLKILLFTYHLWKYSLPQTNQENVLEITYLKSISRIHCYQSHFQYSVDFWLWSSWP